MTPTAPANRSLAGGSQSPAALVFVGALLFGALRQGGYHRSGFVPFVAVVGIAGVLLLATAAGRRGARLGGLTIAPLVVATVASAIAADQSTDVTATLLTLAAIGIAIGVGASVAADGEAAFEYSLLAVGLVVAATAWWGVVEQTAPWGRVTEGVWRGSSSVTYANAAAAMVGPLAVLALGRSISRRSTAWSFSAWSLAVYGLAVGLGATQSRGGIAATALGGALLVGWVLLRGSASRRESMRLLVRATVPVAVAAAATLVLFDGAAVDSEPRRVLMLVVVGVGALGVVGAMRLSDEALTGLVVVAGMVAVIAFAVNVGDIRDVAGRRFSISSTTTALGPDQQVLFGDRGKEWSEAWDQVGERPMLGHGPGVVDLRWEETDGQGNVRRLRAIFVHNEYLELAVTHGLLGVAALIAAVAIATLWWRREGPIGDRWILVWPLLAFLAHSILDFLWHVPVVPVTFAALVGLGYGPPRSAVADHQPVTDVEGVAVP